MRSWGWGRVAVNNSQNRDAIYFVLMSCLKHLYVVHVDVIYGGGGGVIHDSFKTRPREQSTLHFSFREESRRCYGSSTPPPLLGDELLGNKVDSFLQHIYVIYKPILRSIRYVYRILYELCS